MTPSWRKRDSASDPMTTGQIMGLAFVMMGLIGVVQVLVGVMK